MERTVVKCLFPTVRAEARRFGSSKGGRRERHPLRAVSPSKAHPNNFSQSQMQPRDVLSPENKLWIPKTPIRNRVWAVLDHLESVLCRARSLT